MKFTKKTTKIKFTNKKITFIANRHPSADVIFYTEPSAAEIIDATVETIKEYNSEFSKPGEPNAYVTKYKIYNDAVYISYELVYNIKVSLHMCSSAESEALDV